MAVKNHKNDAELCADAFGPRKYLYDLFGPCAGGDVIIGRLDLHDHIAHASPNEICFVPAPAQLLNDLDRGVRLHNYSTSGPPAGLLEVCRFAAFLNGHSAGSPTFSV